MDLTNASAIVTGGAGGFGIASGSTWRNVRPFASNVETPSVVISG